MALPLGLSSALRVFTKCIVATYLRHKGMQIYLYLHDWLMKG